MTDDLSSAMSLEALSSSSDPPASLGEQPFDEKQALDIIGRFDGFVKSVLVERDRLRVALIESQRRLESINQALLKAAKDIGIR